MSLRQDVPPGAPRFDSAEAFLVRAAGQPERYELVDGAARTMTGGSPNHARLSRNALTALAQRLGGRPLRSLRSRSRDHSRPSARGVSRCQRELRAGDRNGRRSPGRHLRGPLPLHGGLRPGLTSASAYRKLPSLRHLVLIGQDRIQRRALSSERRGNRLRADRARRVDGLLALTAIGVGITLSELYAQVTLRGADLLRTCLPAGLDLPVRGWLRSPPSLSPARRPPMPERLVLHLGLHKTATTSLQDFLAGNAEAMQARGVTYLRLARMRSDVSPLIASLGRRERAGLGEAVRQVRRRRCSCSPTRTSSACPARSPAARSTPSPRTGSASSASSSRAWPSTSS